MAAIVIISDVLAELQTTSAMTEASEQKLGSYAEDETEVREEREGVVKIFVTLAPFC